MSEEPAELFPERVIDEEVGGRSENFEHAGELEKEKHRTGADLGLVRAYHLDDTCRSVADDEDDDDDDHHQSYVLLLFLFLLTSFLSTGRGGAEDCPLALLFPVAEDQTEVAGCHEDEGEKEGEDVVEDIEVDDLIFGRFAEFGALQFEGRLIGAGF